MAALLVITYDVSDPERFADYNPGSLPAIAATIKAHDGRVLAGGPAEVIVGSASEATVIVSFPDADAAKAWQEDEEYAPLKAIRYEATTNINEYIILGR